MTHLAAIHRVGGTSKRAEKEGGGGEGDLVFIDGPIIHFSSEADQVSLDRAERIGTR